MYLFSLVFIFLTISEVLGEDLNNGKENLPKHYPILSNRISVQHDLNKKSMEYKEEDIIPDNEINFIETEEETHNFNEKYDENVPIKDTQQESHINLDSNIQENSGEKNKHLGPEEETYYNKHKMRYFGCNNITNSNKMEQRRHIFHENENKDDVPMNFTQDEWNPKFKEGKNIEYDNIQKERENWTTCEEFLDSKLNIKEIVEMQWQVFYYWILKEEFSSAEHYFTFHVPTTTLVQRFKTEMENDMKGLNWTAAELFMETSDGFSALLIARRIPGMYSIVPMVGFEYNLEDYGFKDLYLGLKFIEPHYLGIMNCKYRQTAALAPLGKVPKQKEILPIAAKFNIRSDIGMSYLELANFLKSGLSSPGRQIRDGTREEFYDGIAPEDMALI